MLLVGAAVIVAAAIELTALMYYACNTGGCGYSHYVDWTTVVFWTVGAFFPVYAAVKVRSLGFYCFVALIVMMLTVIGDLFQNAFVSIDLFTSASQHGMELLLVLLTGYGAETAGLALLARGATKTLGALAIRRSTS